MTFSRSGWGVACLAICTLAAAGTMLGQSTQGLLTGRVIDSVTGLPVLNAQVSYWEDSTNSTGTVPVSANGYYVVVGLSPGMYRIRASVDNYQAQEVYNLRLSVAARLEVNFPLRPLSDVWEAGRYRSVFLPGSDAVLTFYGPDVDTSRFASFAATEGKVGALEATVSQVIDPRLIRELPLAGRDVYTMLVTQAGVTADAGTTRGLGLSANGQRPSASNFLLDGIENNNYVVTGPLTTVAPEAVQEYRISTNNFSAEYGRTSGFLANAVTRSGGTAWHGIGYYNLKNEALNANTFQRNLEGLDRAPAREHQGGFHVGGPIPGTDSFFVSGAFERRESRGVQPLQDFRLPSANFVRDFTAPGSIAAKLLNAYPAPAVSNGTQPTAVLRTAPPVTINRTLGLARFDYRPGAGRNQVMARLSLSRLDRPDFSYSPYPDFTMGLGQDDSSVAVSWQSLLSSTTTNELRFGFGRNDLGWDRPHPEIPTLFEQFQGTHLPGSRVFYSYGNKSDSWELNEAATLVRGRHVMKFGGGYLWRRMDTALTSGSAGMYQFDDIVFGFGLDEPSFVFAPLAREPLPGTYRIPDYGRNYKQNQGYLFAQDTFRLAPNVVLNFGLRYENFGTPKNTGPVKDAVFALGSGSSLGDRLANAQFQFGGTDTQELYAADANNWAGRFGVSWDLFGSGATVLRAGYGLYYDRPFDNLWQNVRSNGLVLANLRVPAFGYDYLKPLSDVVAQLGGTGFAGDFPDLTLLDPGMRDAYVHSFIAGVQQRLTENWSIEVNGLGSLGRKLITTDVINRLGSTSGLGNDSRFNFVNVEGSRVFDVSWRSNQGTSNYAALGTQVRYRGYRSQFQLAYTWSHAIDNQSEALAGDFFNLDFTRLSSGSGNLYRSAFTRQFDSSVDRASSDFDQRHNLVFYSMWFLPSPARGSSSAWLLSDWRISQMAAFRTGSPYTVFAPNARSGATLINNRADLIGSAEASGAAAGGERLLNATAFRAATAGQIGNTGRNAFTGPGQFNLDVSLSRSIPLSWLGEGGRITVRADAYNLLNHTNLGQPQNLLGTPDFGVARFGRTGRDTGFPALAPFEENARQIQLILRIEF